MSTLYKPLLTSPECPTSQRSGGQSQAGVSQQHRVHRGPNLWVLRRVGSKSFPPLPVSPPRAVLALGPGIKLPALSLLFSLVRSVSVQMCWLQHVTGKSEHRRGAVSDLPVFTQKLNAEKPVGQVGGNGLLCPEGYRAGRQDGSGVKATVVRSLCCFLEFPWALSPVV